MKGKVRKRTEDKNTNEKIIKDEKPKDYCWEKGIISNRKRED